MGTEDDFYGANLKIPYLLDCSAIYSPELHQIIWSYLDSKYRNFATKLKQDRDNLI